MAESYPIPQIEMCVQNSTMTVHRIDLMFMNWTSWTIPDPYRYIMIGEPGGDPSRCYLFQSNSAFKYGVVEDYDPMTTDIRRIDIYWKIDALENVTAVSLSVPSITMELYNPGFSRWDPPDPENMVPQQKQVSRDMVLGNARSSTSVNTTTTVFFTPTLYRAIRPKDSLSLIGFAPTYVDIPTLETSQLDWDLQRNDENLTRGEYDGLFNLQMAKASLAVQTEQRQHTLLSALALAGGCSTLLTILYILLFGMTRIAPFGVVHQLPMVTIRGVEKIKEHRRNSRVDNNHNNDNNENNTSKLYNFQRYFRRSQPSQLLLDDIAAPAKSDSASNIKDSPVVQHNAILLMPAPAAMAQQQQQQQADEESSRFHGPWDRDYRSDQLSNTSNPSLHSSAPQDRVEGLTMLVEQLQREQRDTAAKAAQLENRLFELQEVLRAYYINMDYLDHQRNMRRRGRRRSALYCNNQRRSTSTEGGWLFDDDDDLSTHKNEPQ
ncbi:hypothetical protein BDB00DRAFT_475466 [Zychaea mexicana]|uniref:uncharacterized protein n=1 Tax=Zychaea mexicana TaxID=64656 RepID=UPI0022FE79A3|nr:uncharacterized protein BDB00DRAFT_475466 [Zychaea mexicana]KAI9491669.1 hypothetical protein BDB00DRAFT_475466 [Zychaea mexicana]